MSRQLDSTGLYWLAVGLLFVYVLMYLLSIK